MDIKGIKSEFAFSRNPVRLYQESYSTDGSILGTFTVKAGSREDEIFSARYMPGLDIEVSDILDGWVDYIPEATMPRATTQQVLTSAGLENYRFRFEAQWKDKVETCELIVIPGGVSRQNFKFYSLRKTDAFQNRFVNYNCNFFLTTRTSGEYIVVKETEISPLYFISNHDGLMLRISDPVSGQYFESVKNRGLYAFHPGNVRKDFMLQKGLLPSMFEIYVDDTYCCRIVIEKSHPAKECHRLKFRNSLGFFDIIELTGELTFQPSYEDEEAEYTFKRLDPDTGDFYAVRERIPRALSASVDTGAKSPTETRLLMDMLGSDEVYLLDYIADSVKVIPSVENMKYSKRPAAPQNFTLKLDFCEQDSNISEDVESLRTLYDTSVFSTQFGEQFN